MKHIISLAVALLLPVALASGQANLHILQKFYSTPAPGTTPGTASGGFSESLTYPQTHIMVDISKAGENSFTYALLSDDISSQGTFAYIQLFHEHKFWEEPLFLHAEYRSYGLDSHCLYLGAAYDLFTQHGMIAIEPLLRNDSLFAGNRLPVLRADATSVQLSIVTGHDWGWCNLNSFTDLWSPSLGGGHAGWYSEAWLYFPLNDWLQLGTIACFSWDFALAAQLTVFLGAKFNL